MDNTRTIESLTRLIDDAVLVGTRFLREPLEDIIGTRRDRNGDLLIEIARVGQAGMVTLRVQITTVL
jgi:hypothetical protein